MELLAALPGVITSCLLAWFLFRQGREQTNERNALREELAAARSEITALARTHAEQLERIQDGHRNDVADLCQRIQAPMQAAIDHSVRHATPDPPPLDLDDDVALVDEADRRLKEFAQQFGGQGVREYAEELAAEA